MKNKIIAVFATLALGTGISLAGNSTPQSASERPSDGEVLSALNTEAALRIEPLAAQAARPYKAGFVREGEEIVCAAHNTREADNDPTGHAEINALREAARVLGAWRLTGCTLYVTLEPCCMCAGAITQARLDRLVFGAYDEQAGCCGSLYRVTEDPAFNHFVIAEGGLMANECARMLLSGIAR